MISRVVPFTSDLQLSFISAILFGISIGQVMINTGGISNRNTTTMLKVSLIEQMVCAIGTWSIGYKVSIESLGGLIGSGLDFKFKNIVAVDKYFHYIVLYSCTQFTSAITTGALAERCYVDTQIVFKVMLVVLIFPIVTSWVWGEGWLYQLGFIDYGGSAVVHMVGGICGFVGTCFLGPRLGLYSGSIFQIEAKIMEKI